MADSAAYAACGQRAATQRHRWVRVMEHAVASKFRGGGATARGQKRKISEVNVTGQAGQTACEVESHGPGSADGLVRLELAGWLGFSA